MASTTGELTVKVNLAWLYARAWPYAPAVRDMHLRRFVRDRRRCRLARWRFERLVVDHRVEPGDDDSGGA